MEKDVLHRLGPLRLPLELSPDNGAALAAIAVETVKKFDNLDLDYSPESLLVIDNIILRMSNQGLVYEECPEPIVLLGCYAGEVFIRHIGGYWSLPTGVEVGLVAPVMGVRSGRSFGSPIGKAIKCLRNGEQDGISAYFNVELRRLKNDA